MTINALKSDFFKAGNHGRLEPWNAPHLAEHISRRFNAEPDSLVSAYGEGQRAAARAAVSQRLAGLSGPADVDVGHALEWAARAADLPAGDLVEIVWDLAPDASAEEGREQMLWLAERALHDYQRVPAHQRHPEPANDPTDVDRCFLADIAVPALSLGGVADGELRRLCAASAWRQFEGELVQQNRELVRIGQEGFGPEFRRREPGAVSVARLNWRETVELWEAQGDQMNSPVRLAALNGERIDAAVDEDVAKTKVAAQGAFDIEREPGLLGDLARWSLSYAFRPIAEFAQLSALATLAPLFGRRYATPTGLGLNLYLVGLATTGSGKEALIGAPPAALEAAGLGFLIGAGDFTSDSAIEVALRARPNFLAPIDEVGEFVGAAQHRNAASHSRTIRKALLELHGKSRPDGRWSGKQKADTEHDKASDPVFSPHLSILGASTGQGFFEALTEANLADGFINRLVVVEGGKPGPRNLDPARLTLPEAIVTALKSAFEAGGVGNMSGTASRLASSRPAMRPVPWADESAKQAWLHVADWEDDARDSGREGITGRAAANTQVIATIRALARNAETPGVTAEDVEWAWSFVLTSIETIERGARENMAGSEFESLVKAIESAVTKAGAAGLPRSVLLRARGVGKHLPQMVDAALKRLEETDVIFKDMRASTGGRPGLRLVARCFGGEYGRQNEA